MPQTRDRRNSVKPASDATTIVAAESSPQVFTKTRAVSSGNLSGYEAASPPFDSPAKCMLTSSVATSNSHVVGSDIPRGKTQPYLVEDDFTDIAYRPHTLGFLAVVCGALTYAAYLTTGSHDVMHNVKVGAGALVFSFLVFCGVYLPDELYVRPHPAVWRVLTGVNLLYLSLIVFLTFQDIPTIRGYLAAIDPKLAHDLPERSYAEDCQLSTTEEPNKWFHTIFDEFLIAHFLGYFCKTLIIRDWRLVLMISVLFEVVELSLQHILPNFKECWWDHIVIDILICNAGGMVAGLLFLRLFGLREMQWVKLSDIPSRLGKLKRIASQLAPRSIDKYQWQMFSSPRRLAIVSFLVIYNLIQELNCFTMKSILQMPPNHKVTIGRLMIWGFIALGSCRGLYVYAVDEGPSRAKRIPMAAWCGFLTLFFECVWINKMRIEGNFFTEPMPAYVGVPLYTSCVLFAAWFVMHFLMKDLYRASLRFRVATNVVFYCIPLCLLALFFMTNVDMQWGRKEFLAFADAYRPFGFDGSVSSAPKVTVPTIGDVEL